MEDIAILIPTYNAGRSWVDVLKSIARQSANISERIIVDSGSTDDTVALAVQYGFRVIQIQKNDFNHGTTRQLLIDSSRTALCIFLTQDAELASEESLHHITRPFADYLVGISYGRQLPRKGATTIETHTRLFNYPVTSVVRSHKDKDEFGFKVFFCSNSFACYRRDSLKAIGGFPSNSIMGEDALAAANMLLINYKIAYVAEATVYHSHDYSLGEEFKRYFDTRVFHEQNPWLTREYGKPVSEGIKFVKSEISFVMRYDPLRFFKVLASICAKWSGYQAGKYYKKLPPSVLRKLSMHAHYWR